MKFLTHTLAAIILLVGCTKPSETARIILDTDIGSSTDDLVAMAMLYDYMDSGKADLLGIMVDRKGERFDKCTALMNEWYGYEDIPIGTVEGDSIDARIFIDYGYIADSVEVKDPVPATQLYRRLLAESPNKSVKVVSIGFLTNLARLLESGPDNISKLSGKELVKKKVACLYVMGGAFSGRVIENYNMRYDLAASQAVLKDWPSEIVFSTADAGRMVDYQTDSVLVDLSGDPGNPLAKVYSECTIDPGQRMWDALAVIHAVEGDSLFTMSPKGNVTLSDTDYQTTFTQNPKGRFSYEMIDSTQASALYAVIRDHVRRK